LSVGGTKNTNKMKEIIEKYEAKLEFINKSLDKTKHLMDSDTVKMMQDVKTLLEEVVDDFRALAK
jgi:DNA-binding ferritin-like protein